MTSNSIGFVGGGRVTRILLGGWKHADCLPPRVLVSDLNEAALEHLRQQFPTVELAPGDNSTAAAQEIVFLAVHPPVMVETLQAIGGSLRANAVLVSLAPKFTTTRLSELLNGFSRDFPEDSPLSRLSW
jgi:pyrroline-5-carboxylate reductase